MENLIHRRASVNGIDLHYVEGGRGPLVVLLHGFPEFWYSWRKQIPALIDAGFRVVAADLRGYNESSKPPHVSDYRLVTIANDIAALIEEELDEPAVLVGHDWGGLVSWLLAMMRPELLRKLVVLNMPHPVPLVREIHRSTRQKLRLAYQLFFRLPMIPELLMPLILPTVLRRAGHFKREEIAEYKNVWRDFETRRGMAHYYRAGLRYGGELRQHIVPIELPTLLIWGERDPVFTRETTENFDESVPNLRIARIARAGHFVQTDAPDQVSELLVDFAR
ncbi:MAG: alpha/beta fold hydrolase [Thermoanaerobaculia bacterium]